MRGGRSRKSDPSQPASGGDAVADEPVEETASRAVQDADTTATPTGQRRGRQSVPVSVQPPDAPDTHHRPAATASHAPPVTRTAPLTVVRRRVATQPEAAAESEPQPGTRAARADEARPDPATRPTTPPGDGPRRGPADAPTAAVHEETPAPTDRRDKSTAARGTTGRTLGSEGAERRGPRRRVSLVVRRRMRREEAETAGRPDMADVRGSADGTAGGDSGRAVGGAPSAAAREAATEPADRPFEPTAAPRPSAGVRDRPSAGAGGPGRPVSLVVRRRMRREHDDSTVETGGPDLVTPRVSTATAPDVEAGTTTGGAGGDDTGRGGDGRPTRSATAAGKGLIDVGSGVPREMPTLTLRAKRGGERVGERGRDTAAGTAPAARGVDRGSVEPSHTAATADVGGDRADRVDPLPGPASAPTRDVTHGRDRVDAPPSGRDAAVRYPGFTFKTLAPRIDVTERADPEPRDVTYRESSGAGRDLTTTSTAVEDLLSGGDLERSRYPSDIDGLIEKLHRDIERKRRIERERRGL